MWQYGPITVVVVYVSRKVCEKTVRHHAARTPPASTSTLTRNSPTNIGYPGGLIPYPYPAGGSEQLIVVARRRGVGRIARGGGRAKVLYDGRTAEQRGAARGAGAPSRESRRPQPSPFYCLARGRGEEDDVAPVRELVRSVVL